MGYIDYTVRFKGSFLGAKGAAKALDAHLVSSPSGSMMFAPQGEPIQNSDGTFKVRCLNPALAFLTKGIIEHNGFEIINEETHG